MILPILILTIGAMLDGAAIGGILSSPLHSNIVPQISVGIVGVLLFIPSYGYLITH